ncbi:hypothetical protein F5Y13DRAFT_184920 [Hypoxylon sp. FL1857]|nr:hypothetical protein F5Y13DRAFT_184920 [Hypoxylon sp. FL1857]
MNATNYHCVVFLFCLWVASLTAAESYSAYLCPLTYLQYDSDRHIYLYATCSVGGDNAQEYHNSFLNLDSCFTNQDGTLMQSNSPAVNFPGGFSGSCWNCAINLLPKSTDGNQNIGFYTHIQCNCRHRDQAIQPANTHLALDDSIMVDGGIIECNGDRGVLYKGTEVSNPSDNKLPMLPPSMSTTVTAITTQNSAVTNTATLTVTATPSHDVTDTFTATATLTQNNTVTVTDTVTASTTIIDTAISTDVTTAVTTATPAPVTITETHKKTHTETQQVTETHNLTETAYVTSVSTRLVTVTETPTPSKTIYAGITSSAFAVFTTEDLPPRQ